MDGRAWVASIALSLILVIGLLLALAEIPDRPAEDEGDTE